VLSYPRRAIEVTEAQPGQPPLDYRFGPYRFDGRLRRLFKDGEPVALTTKAADTLAALLERAGRVVEKDELLRAVWDEVVVGEETLAQNISTLRRVLDDDASQPVYIATVPRRGYRFVAPVQTDRPEAVAHGQTQLPDAPLEAPERSSEPRPARARWRWVAVAGVVGLAIGAGVLATPWLLARNPPRSPVEFTIGEPESAKFFSGGNMLALSPDGQYVTFIATESQGISSIWLRPLNSTTARRLDGTEGVTQTFWSPDSRSIAFFAEQRLKAVEVASGAVRIIATLTSPRTLGGTWGRTGQILFSAPTEGLYVVPATGGTPELLSTLEASCADCFNWPHFLPDGRRFLYTVAASDPSAHGIYVAELGRPGSRRLLDAVSSATFVPAGLVMYVDAGTLYGQRVDPATLELLGAPVPIADGIAQNVRTGRAIAATCEAGVLAFRRLPITELTWVDRGGNPIGVATPPGIYLSFTVAPDGQQVAVAQLDARAGTSDIWIFGPGRVARVTDDVAWEGDPVWSPDGQQLIYSSRRNGRWRIYRRPAMAVGPEELLLDSDTPVIPAQVLRSGEVVYRSRHRGTDLWKLSAHGPTAIVPEGGGTGSARLSFDGQWLAYGWGTLYASALPFGSNRRPLAEGASMPRWRADGRELFYLSRESTIVSVPVEPPRTPGELPGVTLFRAPEARLSGINGPLYDAAPDGQRFLMNREVRSSPIHVVLNWDARLAVP
jgi:DNA-binding winged helix-turn-helix (wHTH) protein/Tol biopolymer transport system component